MDGPGWALAENKDVKEFISECRGRAVSVT
jgi:hypothetical protein